MPRTQAYATFKLFRELRDPLYRAQILGKVTPEMVQKTLEAVHAQWIYVVTEIYDNGCPDDYNSNDVGHFTSESAAQECVERMTDDLTPLQREEITYSHHKIPLF
jgi:hypothetical protein